MNCRLAAAALLAVALLPAVTFAQGSDDRVAEALEDANLNFDVNDGVFEVGFWIDESEERAQTMHIDSLTFSFFGQEFRRCWTIAGVSTRFPSKDDIKAMMLENQTLNLGRWALLETEDGYALVLQFDFPADATGQDYSDVLFEIAAMADRLEQEVTGEDNF